MKERRRYFRINESVGIAYEVLGRQGAPDPEASSRLEAKQRLASLLDRVEEQDTRIEHLLVELEDSHPKVVELISLFNQKLERVVSHILVDSQLLSRMASKLKEANISACGIGFAADEAIEEGTSVHLEITLYPDEKVVATSGRVVACDDLDEGYYWRIDFFGMPRGDQEALIQHIVRTQSLQLRNKRG